MSIFGVSVVDTYNIERQYMAYEDNYCVLLCDLSEDMIHNGLDSRPTRPPSRINGISESPIPVMIFKTSHLFQAHKKNTK